MSISENRLLLLCKAAEVVEQGQGVSDHYYSRYQGEYNSNKAYSSKTSHHHNHYISSNVQRKAVTHTRCTHNELEKSRRAHLRKCMEGLKGRLNFDDESVTRITMLTILKRATATIQSLRNENHNWENRETAEKKRCNHLLMRRQNLRKRLEPLEWKQKNMTARFQLWRERNRNASECSIATTSSEDSELELAFAASQSDFLRCFPPTSSRQTINGLKKIVSPTTGLEDGGSDSGYESPKLVRPGPGGVPLTSSLDKLCVRERGPVLSSGCSGC